MPTDRPTPEFVANVNADLDARQRVSDLVAQLAEPLQAVASAMTEGKSNAPTLDFLASDEADTALQDEWAHFAEQPEWSADELFEGMAILLLMAVGTESEE